MAAAAAAAAPPKRRSWAVRPAFAISVAPRSVRPLFDDAVPTGLAALQRQRANLFTFVQDHVEDFDRMMYSPWVTPNPAQTKLEENVVVRPSSLFPGLLGVFPLKPIQTAGKEKLILHYYGLLVTDALFAAFRARYHCPTGIGVPALGYIQDGQEIRINIIADPTSPAAIVNDGSYKYHGADRVNCGLKTVAHHLRSAILVTDVSAKQLVSAEAAQLFVLYDQHLDADTELLVTYGKYFWDDEGEHCVCCFARSETRSGLNPIILCSGISINKDGDDEPCTAGRHRYCFTVPPSIADIQDPTLEFLCPLHMDKMKSQPALRQAPAAAASASATHRSRAKPISVAPPGVKPSNPSGAAPATATRVAAGATARRSRLPGGKLSPANLTWTGSSSGPNCSLADVVASMEAIGVTHNTVASNVPMSPDSCVASPVSPSEWDPRPGSSRSAIPLRYSPSESCPDEDECVAPSPHALSSVRRCIDFGPSGAAAAATHSPSVISPSPCHSTPMVDYSMHYTSRLDQSAAAAAAVPPPIASAAALPVPVPVPPSSVDCHSHADSAILWQHAVSLDKQDFSSDCVAAAAARAQKAAVQPLLLGVLAPDFMEDSPAAAELAREAGPQADCTDAFGAAADDSDWEMENAATGVLREVESSNSAMSESDTASSSDAYFSASDNDYRMALQPRPKSRISAQLQRQITCAAGSVAADGIASQSGAPAALGQASWTESNYSTQPQLQISIQCREHRSAKVKPGFDLVDHAILPSEAAMIDQILRGYLDLSEKEDHRSCRGGTKYKRRWFLPSTLWKPTAPLTQSVAAAAKQIELGHSRSAAAPSPSTVSSGSSQRSRTCSWKTTERWRSPTALQHDWAEYHSCCAGNRIDRSAVAVAAADAADGTSAESNELRRKLHSSQGRMALFRQRVQHRANVTTKAAWDMVVLQTLRDGKQTENYIPFSAAALPGSGKQLQPQPQVTVRWDAQDICHSCYRAVLGVGRNYLFRLVKVDPAELVKSKGRRSDKLTPFGAPRIRRAAPKRDHAVRVLLGYLKAGSAERQPNPAHSSLNLERFHINGAQRYEDLAELLAQYEQKCLGSEQKAELIPKHILSKARKELAKHHGMALTLGSKVQIVRCADCDYFDNLLSAANQKQNPLTPEEIGTWKQRKTEHLRQMQEQRDNFNTQKEYALSNPRDLWCITFDGMDQSKTQLPSRSRFSKKLEPLPRLKLHTVGGFCFGGPEPIVGLINLPDLRKDSSLSVTILDRILDLQWLKLTETYNALKRRPPECASKAQSWKLQLARAAEIETNSKPQVASEVRQLQPEVRLSQTPRMMQTIEDDEEKSGDGRAAAAGPGQSLAAPMMGTEMMQDQSDPKVSVLTDASASTYAADAAAVAAAAEAGAAAAVASEAPQQLQLQPSDQEMNSSDYQGPGLDWPCHLHVTFDNAAGESKNQWMFRYLGLLVLHGIFQTIRVSTLIVGHTHDIVDQMFSVWSRLLRIANAETLSKLKALFTERYTSRIEGMVQLMEHKQREMGLLTDEEMAAYIKERESSEAEFADSQTRLMEEFSSLVATMTDLTPHIELVSVNIEVQGWIKTTLSPTFKTLPPLQNVTVPHCFAIQRCPNDGGIYLYNKYLANSAVESNSSHSGKDIKITHHYPITPCGAFSTRALLYPKGTTCLMDPYRMPPLFIDTKPLHETSAAFLQEHAMTEPDHTEFSQMLETLTQAQEKQQQDCTECLALMLAYCKHGVISTKKGTPAEQVAARGKANERGNAYDRMRDHLYDERFRERHNTRMMQSNWWGKWIDRATKIQLGRIANGKQVNPDEIGAPYHMHPVALCSNGAEPPIHVATVPERHDQIRFQNKGPPQIGDYFVARAGTQTVTEPMWIGQIMEEKGGPDQPEATDSEATAAAAATATLSSAAAAASEAQNLGRSSRGNNYCGNSNPILHIRRDLVDREWMVRYWDLWPTEYKKFDRKKTKHWPNLFKKHNTTEEAVARQFEESNSRRFPEWIVDEYKNVKFFDDPSVKVDAATKVALTEEELRAAWTPLSGGTLIAWGPLDELLTQVAVPEKEKRFGAAYRWKPAMWKTVRQDLTEVIEQNNRGAGGGGGAKGKKNAAIMQQQQQQQQHLPESNIQFDATTATATKNTRPAETALRKRRRKPKKSAPPVHGDVGGSSSSSSSDCSSAESDCSSGIVESDCSESEKENRVAEQSSRRTRLSLTATVTGLTPPGPPSASDSAAAAAAAAATQAKARSQPTRKRAHVSTYAEEEDEEEGTTKAAKTLRKRLRRTNNRGPYC